MSDQLPKNFEDKNITLLDIINLIWNTKYQILSLSGIITLVGLALFIFAANGLKAPEKYVVLDIKKTDSQLNEIDLGSIIKTINISQSIKSTDIAVAEENIIDNIRFTYGNENLVKILNQISGYSNEDIQKKFKSENSYLSVVNQLKDLESNYGQIRLNIVNTSINEEAGKMLVSEIVKNGENRIKQEIFYDRNDYFFGTYDNYRVDANQLSSNDTILKTYFAYSSVIKSIMGEYSDYQSDIAVFKKENLINNKSEYDFYLRGLIISKNEIKNYIIEDLKKKIAGLNQNIKDKYELFEIFNNKYKLLNTKTSELSSISTSTSEGIDNLIALGAKLNELPLNSDIILNLKKLLDEKKNLNQELKNYSIEYQSVKSTEELHQVMIIYINNVINEYNDFVLTRKNLLKNENIFNYGTPYILHNSILPNNINLFSYVMIIISLIFSTLTIIIRKYLR